MDTTPVRWLALAFTAICIGACNGPPYYTSEPFDVRVVDAGTGQPIEGAFVFAWWPLYKWSFDAPRTGSLLKVLETVTDRDGRFHIEGFTRPNLTFERLRAEDPGLIVYKPGYFFGVFFSAYTLDELEHLGATRKSKLAGKTVGLKRFDGDNERMRNQLLSVFTDLGPIATSCLWTMVPRIILAVDAEAKRIRREEPSVRFTAVTIEGRLKDCGAATGSLSSAAK